MQITDLAVKGANIKSLSTLLGKTLPHCRWNISNDVMHVFVNEKHFIRSDGLMMTTVIVDYSKEHTAQIQIIVGGGGPGLFNLDWNVEKRRTKQIIASIDGFCQLEDWQLKMQKEEIIEEFED